MKIFKGRVDWNEGCANRPTLQLLVDAIPARETLRFTQRGLVYFAEQAGYCDFFYWSGQPDHGYGSTAFHVTMQDGSSRYVRGPWSSNSMTVNRHEFGPCLEVLLTTNWGDFCSAMGPWRSGAVLVSRLREVADRIDVGAAYAGRPATRAAVTFPQGSRFALACTGHVNAYGVSRFVRVPEVFHDGVRIEDLQRAVRAVQDVDPRQAIAIARPYQRFLPWGDTDPVRVLWALSSYEPAVRLPDGTLWTKPSN